MHEVEFEANKSHVLCISHAGLMYIAFSFVGCRT